MLPVVAAGALVLTSCTTQASHGADQTYNILPPGQAGSVPPTSNSTDQLRLYDGLTPLGGSVTAGDIGQYYKSEQFGVSGPSLTESVPRAGLRIQRDAFDVPHVTGQTRADVEYGAGWVTAKDRGLFIETIRGPARIAALDAPGLDAFKLATSLQTFVPSPDTERFLTAEQSIIAATPKGRQVLADTDAYVSGINAYYKSTNNSAAPWTRNDVLADAALIGAVFGKGGGDEVRRSEFLSALEARLGPQAGSAVWRDLREAQDPAAPTTLSQRFSYEPTPSGPTPGSVAADAGSTQAPPTAPAAKASNALLVSASRSANGHPLAVMGPQVGYFYPQFLMELDLHGGGIDARGAAFPGVSMYVLLGRGKHYAWSATSSSSDDIDQFLEQLCNPDGSPPTRASTSYLFQGQCRAMTTFSAGVLMGSAGQPPQNVAYYQTIHGPVSGTATVAGRPYAITTERSTRGRDALSALAFADLNTNAVHSANDFAPVMNQVNFSFNWFYVDDKDIAYFSSGQLPVRAQGVDPSLPTLGTGQYEWRGFLSQAQHAQAIDPPSGVLLNWNNKPAPGWGAADDNWSYGAVYRVQLFTGVKANGNHLQDLVSVMNRAATEDLPAVVDWPLIARVLSSGAPDPTTQQARDLVSAWVAKGASRLAGPDGKIDDPGAAVLDAAWPLLARTELAPVLGPLAESGPGTLSDLIAPDQPANNQGSSYADGWYGYVDKDLHTILGDHVAGPYSRVYCGNGDLGACRASLWTALKAAVDQLVSSQGPDPRTWSVDATPERISFEPGLLGPSNTMRWTNRPTFQQVVSFQSGGG